MDIATKLGWEIVALNDRGDATERELLAHEIAYGIALKVSDLPTFHEVINSIIAQVTSKDLQTSLRKIVLRLYQK